MAKKGLIFSLLISILSISACGSEAGADITEQSDIFESIAAEEPVTDTSEESEKMQETSDEHKVTDVIDESAAIPAGTLSDSGIHRECIELIEDIIKSDIEYGFTSAQLSIIKDGKLVYENSFGKTNTYNKDGSVNTDSAEVTNDTLYDIASISKMIGVNYALQKLATDGKIDINSRISEYLGQEFVDDTIYIDYTEGSHADLETIKKWKSSLTIASLLKHQGGFPASPRYCVPTINAETQKYDPDTPNILFSANSADANAKKATIKAICKTPLLYEPGSQTLYSDVDYMILGLVVEKVTGKDLDTYLKETFCEPIGLTHVTYNPLENGFKPSDCAATELNGNTRDGYISYDGIRTETIQGQVHDEMAYYCMGGISGHAGIFANATDLARLGTIMLTGSYGDKTFFSKEIIEKFTAPKSEDAKNWGLGWWRQGDMQRTRYFGSRSSSRTFGHQGWTGTLLMIDPDKNLVIAYLTNKINSPVTDNQKNANKFNGNWYTSSTLGFVPEILYIGMDEDVEVKNDLLSYLEELTKASDEAIKSYMADSHPARKNAASKHAITEKYN